MNGNVNSMVSGFAGAVPADVKGRRFWSVAMSDAAPRGSFGWLNATQFLGAFNDNLFKLLLVFFLLARSSAAEANRIMALTGAVFVMPFLLFTPAAGVLADRVSKRSIIVWAKVLEILVMLAGALTFRAGSALAAYGVLFMMAAQSALFGPAKYGIVPELVGSESLSRANARLMAATFLAVILGTAAAPILSEWTGRDYTAAALVCVAVAAAGAATSLGVARTRPAAAGCALRPRDLLEALAAMRADRYLLLAVLGSAYFNMIGAFLQMNLIPYGIQKLGLSEERSGYLFMLAAFGIGAGSLLAGRLSGRHIEFGVVPLGALGLSMCAVAADLVPATLVHACPVIFLTGLCAGLFIVPLEAFIQFSAPERSRGRILAASAFLSWLGILVAAGMLYLLGHVLGLSAAKGFVAIGALTVALAATAFRLLPDFLLRFVAMLVTRLFYRIEVIGAENVPAVGGALLVSNHVSLADAFLIAATQQRRVRFVMGREIYERFRLKPLFRLMGVIPISPADPPRKIVEALRQARAALDDGYLVCIFGEGAITRTGMMGEFKSGLERIVSGTSHPVIPVYIGGAWGSIFSYYDGRLRARPPRRLPYPVTVAFGRPLPSSATAGEVRQAVMELSNDYFHSLRRLRRSLPQAFVGAARRHWRRLAMADSTGKRLTYGRTLSAAFALADALRGPTADRRHVGVLLPPSAAGALANLAVSLLGKVPVNLNFTVAAAAYDSALRQARIATVVSARAFLERFPTLADKGRIVFIEDLMAGIGPRARLAALLKALFLPARLLACPADSPATVIFSSGTTGEPKGVMLSHHNILSNVESVRMALRPRPGDNVCASLPLFHSFGLTCGVWLPLLAGFTATYCASPLDSQKVAEMVRTHRCTILFSTPTFLMSYIRRAAREDFASLRLVIAGAEKLKPRLADAFEQRFGIRPLEGYGATELSPVVALNLPDADVDGVYQAGTREGSVGQPIPGVAARIVHPDTLEPVPPGQSGLLMIKGPNVMLGYLDRPDLTAEALDNGWYRTGDIAHMDADGFIFITDRLSRFSKIGGEMVPHHKIEEEYLRALNRHDSILAVTSIPHPKKGERLVVLHTPEAGAAAALHAIIEKAPIPNLWKPDRDAYCLVENLPVTGTGKLDVRALRRIAAERLDPEAAGGSQ